MREDTSSPPPIKEFQMSQLSYKQLQGKLKAVKEQGYQLNVKLNAKQEALQLEWERITADLETQAQGCLDKPRHQEALTPSAADELQSIDQQYCNFFPTLNTQKVNPQSCYTTEFKGAKLFVIGGANYFMHEVDQWLRDNHGAACEVKLTAEAKASLFSGGYDAPALVQDDLSAQAQEPALSSVVQEQVPSITALLGLLVAVLLLIGLSICSKAWLGLKALAVATGEPTCTQAAQNAEWLYGCALAFIQGLAVPDQQGF
jgi:hypothetical protein